MFNCIIYVISNLKRTPTAVSFHGHLQIQPLQSLCMTLWCLISSLSSLSSLNVVVFSDQFGKLFQNSYYLLALACSWVIAESVSALKAIKSICQVVMLVYKIVRKKVQCRNFWGTVTSLKGLFPLSVEEAAGDYKCVARKHVYFVGFGD